jgi:soluble lytic murein transglycosylase-like protein
MIAGCCLAIILFYASAAKAEDLCFDEAGMQYGINPQILRAIAKVESGFNPRAVNRNTNGSYDFGVMQINSLWGRTYGEEWWSTLGDPCTNIKAGAMILASCMKKYGYSWEAIGCYNSQIPGKRNKYAITVFKQLQRIERDERLASAKSIKDNPKDTSAVPVTKPLAAQQQSVPEEEKLALQNQSPAETEPEQSIALSGE